MIFKPLFKSLALLIPALVLLAWFMHCQMPPLPTVHAQAPDTLCDQTVVVASTPSGSSATIAAAASSQRVYICGFAFGGDAATSAVTFQSGGVSITGPIRVANGLALAVSADAVNLYGTPGLGVTVLVGTGNVSGYVKFGQR